MLSALIRVCGTAIILVIVWRHSHWSVALCITGQRIGEEVSVFNDWYRLRLTSPSGRWGQL